VTLSTGCNDQDVKAMIELYSHIINTLEVQHYKRTTQKADKTTHLAPQSTQKMDAITQKISNVTQETDTTTQKKEPATTQKVDLNSISTSEKIVLELKKNPSLSRKQLAQLIPTITEDGVKYHLSKLQERGIIRRIGPDKGGHWEILI
ncbi:MAG: hypothetical protein K2K08_10190, partial [Paramuribaculum sp.]|nr:hypothetical protein [Paramuribaculum sp.]